MNKFWGLGMIAGLTLLAIIAFSKSAQIQTLGGRFERGCTASSTAWTVGPENAQTILPANGLRAGFVLSNVDASALVYYRLQSTVPGKAENTFLGTRSTVVYDERFPYRGAITASSTASSTLSVTECLYTNS